MTDIDHALLRAVASGAICAECMDEHFRTPLKTPTACVECWNKLPPDGRGHVVKANRNEQESVIRNKALNAKRKG